MAAIPGFASGVIASQLLSQFSHTRALLIHFTDIFPFCSQILALIVSFLIGLINIASFILKIAADASFLCKNGWRIVNYNSPQSLEFFWRLLGCCYFRSALMR